MEQIDVYTFSILACFCLGLVCGLILVTDYVPMRFIGLLIIVVITYTARVVPIDDFDYSDYMWLLGIFASGILLTYGAFSGNSIHRRYRKLFKDKFASGKPEATSFGISVKDLEKEC